MTSFRLSGLSQEPFEPLFAMTDKELAAIHAVRMVATENPGFPCRVSLDDAEVSEEVLLLPFQHQPAASPFRASGPIFVRRGATQRVLMPGEMPEYVTCRQISVRAYDAAHMMLAAAVHAGCNVAEEIEQQFADPRIAYIHLHNAKRGCFLCAVDRA